MTLRRDGDGVPRPDGTVVAESRTTMIETGKAPTEGGFVMADLGRLEVGAPPRRASTARSAAPTWCATRARRATSTRSTTTRSSPSRPGYPSVFSVGMLQAGILAGFATDWLGAANVALLRVQFREQVWPGDTVVCSGTVTRKYEDDGERKVDVDLLCTRQRRRGGAAIKGEATFVVP